MNVEKMAGKDIEQFTVRGGRETMKRACWLTSHNWIFKPDNTATTIALLPPHSHSPQPIFSVATTEEEKSRGEIGEVYSICPLSSAGIFKQSMVARNRVGIGLPYRPARQHRLAELIPWNRFPGCFNVYKFGLRSVHHNFSRDGR